jgi:hypothetical protein
MGAVRVRSATAHGALSVRAGLGGCPRRLSGARLNDTLTVTEGRAGTLVCGGAAMAPGEGKVMSWFWLNIPLDNQPRKYDNRGRS